MIQIRLSKITVLTELVLFLFISEYTGFCQENSTEYRLDAIEVFAEKSARMLDSSTLPVTVITRDEIDALGAATITEVLEMVASVELKERGTPGSQADISIRGSSNEGVLILIDGVRVHDPQTGHYTLDNPFGIESVERIEILTGGGSGIYGGSAPGGVINIVTGGAERGVTGGFTAGSFGTGTGRMTLSHEFEKTRVTVSLRGGRSDGYRDDSDLSYSGVESNGIFNGNRWRIQWNLGMLNKTFGAGDFYGPYPSEEETSTFQGGFNLSRTMGENSLLRFRFGSRGHDDTYTLIRTDPAYYQNLHFNRSTSAAAEFVTELSHTVTVISGMEAERFGITSGSLGKRADETSAFYTQTTTVMGPLTIAGVARLDAGYRDERIFSPSLGFSYGFPYNITLRLRSERSYRPPTYTELYYSSPANMGNQSLHSEKTTSIETGIDYQGTKQSASITVFSSEGSDVIDWIRRENETIWRAENHGQVLSKGAEASLKMRISSGWLFYGSALTLNQNAKGQNGIISKYALNPLDRVVSCSLSGPLLRSVTGTVMTRYEHQLHGSTRIPVTVRISVKKGSFLYRFGIDNIFNEQYEEIPGLPASGQWFTFQVEFTK